MTMQLQPVTGGELADAILSELGDTEETIWSKTDDIIPLIQDVIYDFVTRTYMIWKKLPLADVIGQATYVIPTSYNFHQMDRAEYDSWGVNPTPARQMMAGNGAFESAGNRPFTYLMQGDGIGTLRKIGVPTSGLDSSNPSRITIDEFGDIDGTFNSEKRTRFNTVGYAPGAEGLVKFYIEFFAVGDPVTADAIIDLPPRYLLSYVASGVKAKAYQIDGDGQSLKLAELWTFAYEDGIKMAQRRRDNFFSRRISNIGSDGKIPTSYRSRNPGTLPAYFPKVE